MATTSYDTPSTSTSTSTTSRNVGTTMGWLIALAVIVALVIAFSMANRTTDSVPAGTGNPPTTGPGSNSGP